ncbi:MAG: TIGR02302 family protein [Parvibaculaceae bacterium]
MSGKSALRRLIPLGGPRPEHTPLPEGARPLPRRIERLIFLARALLGWEYLWGALWIAIAITGLYTAAALVGLFENLPLGLHWALIASYTLVMALVLWRGLRQFRWPTREAALHHLEGASGLTHQPLSAYEDVAAQGSGDPQLWAAHQTWVADRLKKLKLGTVAPGLVERDPYGLRAIVLLLLVIGVAGTGSGRMTRIAGAFFPGAGAARSFTIEAWITPPSYTGQNSVFLERGESGTQDPDFKPVMSDQIIKVPIGSTISIRAHGLRNLPSLETGTEDRGRPASLTDLGNANSMIDEKITATSEFSLTLGGRLLRSWSIETTPDLPPAIHLTMPLQETASGALHFAYEATDDYGVKAAYARVTLADNALSTIQATPDAPGEPAKPENPALTQARKKLAALFRQPRANALVKPPVVNLPLKTLHAKDGKGEAYADLTSHPWAGLPVIVTLVATDDAGQEGMSEPVAVNLPARVFTKPLAAATIEQRRALAFRPSSINRVARVINDLTADASPYIDEPAAYLGLRAAYWRMLSAKYDDDLYGVYDLLWAVALRLEDGDLSLAESDLRRARDALSKGLEQNAPQEEISHLVQELKAAFKRYMDAIAAKAGDNPDQAMIEKFAPQNGQTIDRETLEEMLGEIGDLAEGGAREDAKRLLAEMQGIMENLQTPDKNSELTDEQKAAAAAIEKLSGLIDKEKKLMDETFRAGPEGSGGAGDKHSKSLKALADEQKKLSEDLAALAKSLDDANIEKPASLTDAGKQMRNAEERLKDQRTDRATISQSQSIDAMRAAAQGMADELAEGMKGQKGQKNGKGQPNGSAEPFGNARQEGDPGKIKIPAVSDRLKARAIIEDLRRRAGELGRPQSELDYLDRLLNRF